jgi:hypothetical protein
MLSHKLKCVFAAFLLREWEPSGWFRILKLCPWKWEYDHKFAMHNMNEWTLNSRFVYVAYIDVFPIFRHIKSNNSGTAKVKIVKNKRDPPLFTSKQLIKF